MSRRVCQYIVGSFVLLALTGCGGWFMEQREPWRHEAEVACLKSGQVKITPAVAQLPAISGPDICGADFPLKVSALGDSPMLGFADDLRPPGTIPSFPSPGPRQPAPTYGSPPGSSSDRYVQPYRPRPSHDQPYPPQPTYEAQEPYPSSPPGAPISLKPPGMEEDEDY